MGTRFWRPLLDFLDRLVEAGTIDVADAARIVATDSATEAVEAIRRIGMSRFALSYGARARRRWYLWE
jgi:predicted Rossmann-fold nucleotide-binding protein